MQVNEMISVIQQNPAMRAQLMENPEETMGAIAAGSPLQKDVTIYRIVVLTLGLTLMAGMLGALILGFYGKEIPAEATALGSAAVGALAGLLAPSPRQ